MRNLKSTTGFTLIEVLIAMTLLSIMVSVLFGSMKICADSWQKGEEKIAYVNETAVVYQFFQQHLTTAKPLWDDFSTDEKQLSFQGQQHSFQFVSAFPASARKSGLQLFKVNLLKDREENFIKVTTQPFYPASEKEEWSSEEVDLLTHVDDFTISYYGIDESQPEGYWQDEWTNRETMPKLIKIKIARDDGNFWPEMIFDIKSPSNIGSSDGQVLSDEDRAQAEAAALESQ